MKAVSGWGKHSKLGNDYLTAVLERHLYRRAYLDRIVFGYRKIRDHQEHRLLVEFYNYIDEWRLFLESCHVALMHNRECMDPAASTDRLELERPRQTRIA